MIELFVHRVTNDPDFPTPYRYWYGVDTPFGHHDDQGLCRTEEACVEEATARFFRWVEDQKVARASQSTHLIAVDPSIYESS